MSFEKALKKLSVLNQFRIDMNAAFDLSYRKRSELVENEVADYFLEVHKLDSSIERHRLEIAEMASGFRFEIGSGFKSFVKLSPSGEVSELLAMFINIDEFHLDVTIQRYWK